MKRKRRLEVKGVVGDRDVLQKKNGLVKVVVKLTIFESALDSKSCATVATG
jgi:hypothetical protein